MKGMDESSVQRVTHWGQLHPGDLCILRIASSHVVNLHAVYLYVGAASGKSLGIDVEQTFMSILGGTVYWPTVTGTPSWEGPPTHHDVSIIQNINDCEKEC